MYINFKFQKQNKTPGYPLGESGFLILEKVLALGIGSLVSVLMITTSISVLKHVNSTALTSRLTSSASFITDNTSYRLRQASSVTPLSSTSFRIVSASGSVDLTWSSSSLFISGQKVNEDDVAVNTFWYKSLPRSVQYGFTLSSGSHPKQYSATTSVALRR